MVQERTEKTVDKDIITYSYVWGTKETFPGEIQYDKKNKKTNITKIAENDDEIGAKWAEFHFEKVINDGFPEKRLVMIG